MINFRMSFRRIPNAFELRNPISSLTNRFLSSFEMTLLIFLCLTFSEVSFAQDKSKIDFESCTYNDFPLYGKIKFVESFPDIKIKFVESFPGEP